MHNRKCIIEELKDCFYVEFSDIRGFNSEELRAQNQSTKQTIPCPPRGITPDPHFDLFDNIRDHEEEISCFLNTL